MNDYLSRKEILRVFDNLTVKNPDDKYQHGMQDAIDCLIPEVINGMEAADTVKHGNWEDDQYNDCLHCYSAICSECGYESTDQYSITNNHKYCEYCGARMDGEQNE